MEKRRYDCPVVPKGWHKEDVPRKQALTSGKPDIVYYSTMKSTSANLKSELPDEWQDSELVAAASTGDDETIESRVNKLKHLFHKDRFLELFQLPNDVMESEIRTMLSDYPVSGVSLSRVVGAATTATVTLEDPDMLEDWDESRIFFMRGQPVSVAPSSTPVTLCISRLPLYYTHHLFSGLVNSFGAVNLSFLMISEQSGKSKGYGFVQYTHKDVAAAAQKGLNGMVIDKHTLYAELLNSCLKTFESLHSKCLFVENLPNNYRDMGEFRNIFSCVVKPPYCQIALQNGLPLDWGLVEFTSGEDAEATLDRLNGFKLHGKKLKISYCIPGIRAINLYLQLLNESSNHKKGSLLPDPPAPAVYQVFRNLQKQNPVFAQNVQSIMLSELRGDGDEENKSKNQFDLPPPSEDLISGIPLFPTIHPFPDLPVADVTAPLDSSALADSILLQTVMSNAAAFQSMKQASDHYLPIQVLPGCLSQCQVVAPVDRGLGLSSSPLPYPQEFRYPPHVYRSSPSQVEKPHENFDYDPPYKVAKTRQSRWEPARFLESTTVPAHRSSSGPSAHITPIGHKRKYTNFLPSPESSPEGNYIGQHSQGLGGHYARR